jgi:hypothetical protein
MDEKTCSAKNVVIQIDDAQETYGDKDGWRAFIKESYLYIPGTVKFIISCTHNLDGGQESPAEFASLQSLKRQDFLLSNDEADEFLSTKGIGLRDDMQNFSSLKQTIILQCGGLVGALRVSVNGLGEAFFKTTPTETDAILLYFSDTVLLKMARVFGSDHQNPMGLNFKAFLADCFTKGFRYPIDFEENDSISFKRLQKAGILVEVGGCFGFSSLMAKRYFIRWLFPHRSSENPSTLRDLLEKCIGHMSCSTLSGGVDLAGFPKEATFQHIFMEGLALFTSPSCSICPELSKAFPMNGLIGELFYCSL